jgi:DNA-binding response OmpR family regulator
LSRTLILLPKVLLIDDSATQLHVREAVLRSAGFPVLTAMTADEALSRLREPAIAASLGVIVTDHVMPGASGADFVRELRSANSSVPVIVVSGMAEAEEEYSGLNVRFLHKPCAPEDLIRHVRSALEKS